jgi:hypothetical protein
LLPHPPSGNAGRIGELVTNFADGCVLPAAKSAGTRHTRPAFGPRSAVTLAAEMMFTRLADAADGEGSFSDETQELWDDLISGCLAEQVAIDRNELQ